MYQFFNRIKGFCIRRFYKFFYFPAAHKKIRNINILNSLESIKYIIDHQCSVSRFGDGEFDVMLGRDGNTFQKANSLLAERLRGVLVADDAPNHIVGIPLPLKSTTNLRKESKEFWDYYTHWNVDSILPFLFSNRRYVDTQLSRFYIIYNNKRNCHNQINMLKEIWQDKDLLIVEGCKSRTGIGNDLYDNARSIKRILGPATNAFAKYDEMLAAILKYADKNQLILLSYGMCATVLAYDLAKLGYWAIDIGHLDIEYEWYLQKAETNVAIKGKFTNEAKEQCGHNVEDCSNEQYFNQIIYDITKI